MRWARSETFSNHLDPTQNEKCVELFPFFFTGLSRILVLQLQSIPCHSIPKLALFQDKKYPGNAKPRNSQATPTQTSTPVLEPLAQR
eukprot:3860662-Amphidinium_carterae.1